MRLRSIGFLLILAAELSYAIRPPSNEINVEKEEKNRKDLGIFKKFQNLKFKEKMN